ncbi:hypothetical protein PYCH_07810 [Pyrococcus yayanosii CH1]|uniref:Uncharacterized protein n=1 Tax=Pyrococcus yayanosii (strain CH1 / JCM 16557) TaxID=529709 RepID=F8AIZ0_PYRYC|nr:hypothetical protein PYCH_07810 [Pyrococcus yayanosii CH1]
MLQKAARNGLKEFSQKFNECRFKVALRNVKKNKSKAEYPSRVRA